MASGDVTVFHEDEDCNIQCFDGWAPLEEARVKALVGVILRSLNLAADIVLGVELIMVREYLPYGILIFLFFAAANIANTWRRWVKRRTRSPVQYIAALLGLNYISDFMDVWLMKQMFRDIERHYYKTRMIDTYWQSYTNGTVELFLLIHETLHPNPKIPQLLNILLYVSTIISMLNISEGVKSAWMKVHMPVDAEKSFGFGYSLHFYLHTMADFFLRVGSISLLVAYGHDSRPWTIPLSLSMAFLIGAFTMWSFFTAMESMNRQELLPIDEAPLPNRQVSTSAHGDDIPTASENAHAVELVSVDSNTEQNDDEKERAVEDGDAKYEELPGAPPHNPQLAHAQSIFHKKLEEIRQFDRDTLIRISFKTFVFAVVSISFDYYGPISFFAHWHTWKGRFPVSIEITLRLIVSVLFFSLWIHFARTGPNPPNFQTPTEATTIWMIVFLSFFVLQFDIIFTRSFHLRRERNSMEWIRKRLADVGESVDEDEASIDMHGMKLEPNMSIPR